MFLSFKTNIKSVIFIILSLFPLLGMCQLSTPQWVNDIGGPGSSSIPSAVKADKQDNVYVSGTYSGTVDFDPTAGVYNLTSVGGFDTYVAKYTSAGKLIWAISVGGSGTDQVNTMTLDNNGNPTISGQYSADMDADPGPGVFTLHNKGDNDAFMIRFDTNGNLSWAKSIGGSGTDYGDKVASDSNGNIIETIQYQSTVTVGTQTFTSGGSTFNALIIKYDINGNLLWVINLRDSGDAEARYSTIDKNDNIIISGEFSGNVNFNPLGTAYNLNGNGGSTYLAKYTSGGILLWVNQISGTVVGNNTNVCVNSTGDIYIDGPFSSTLNFGANNTLSPAGFQDIFIAKYNANGVFQFDKDIGGSSASIYNYGIEMSLDDNIYVSGYFSGTIDFDPSSTAKAPVTYHGQRDLFLAKFDGNINYKWAFSVGNANCNNTLGRNVTVDNNNDVLLVGSFCSTVNFDASTCTSYNLTAQSNTRDSFVAKYVQSKADVNSQITAISIPEQSAPAVIDQNNLKITLTVPAGTNVKALTPQITVTNSTKISPASGTSQNFTAPVTYTLTNGCSSLNYSVSVEFSNGYTITTCPGLTANLIGGTTVQVPTVYLWQVQQNNVWVNANGVNNQKDYTTPVLLNISGSPITYLYRRQITVQGNISYDSNYTINVPSVIANNIIAAPPVVDFCLNGNPGIISGSIPSGGSNTISYQWQSSADGITFTDIQGATLKDYDPPVINTTTYYRRAVISGACVTPVFSNIITIKIYSGPVANAGSDITICNGSSAVLNASGGINYQWSPAMGLSNTNTANPTASPLVTTTYTVSVSNGNCSTTASVTVNVIQLPIVNAGNDQQIINGQSINLNGTVPGSNVQYHWSPSTYLNNSNILNPVATPAQDITYTLYVTSANSCFIVSDNVFIKVYPNIVIPNTFTPNADGINDAWNIPALNTYANCMVNVFNRYGTPIFKSIGYSKAWNGEYNNQPVSAGTYYYTIDLKDGSKIISGWIAVIR